MSDTVRLVYAGEIVKGFESEAVKRDVGQRLKLEGAALDRLFTGKKVVVRRQIERAKAERMVKGLKKYGALFQIEAIKQGGPETTDPGLSGPTPLDFDEPEDPLHAHTQVLEHVMCENCGEVQYMDERCQTCGSPLKQAKHNHPVASVSKPRGGYAVNEDGFAVDTQGALISTLMPPTPEMLAELERSRQSKAAPPEWSQFESPTFFSLSFRGRMGRVYFSIGVLLGFGAMTWLGMALVLFPFWPVLYGTSAGAAFVLLWVMRLIVVRLHDLDFRSAWLLAFLVPGLNLLLLLLLMFWPGNKVFNRFGHPPMAANVTIGLAAVLLLTFDTLTIGAIALEPVHRQDVHWDEWPPVAIRDFSMDRHAGQAPVLPDDEELKNRLHSVAGAKAFKEGYWLSKAERAFAASPDGAFGWAGNLDDGVLANERALSDCRKLRRPYGPDCRIVHVNNIWTSGR